ncbi:MAG TPA: ABC transporter ATP-binding protein [Firmicutes bacterium]|nr:ABC transporter ATP-binding protein [Candidatus Fermentithermobacillaceae bacterium]
MAPLLSVRNLHTTFYTSDGRVPAVRGVSLDIEPGETLGVVGESGCGKSVTAFSVMRLIPSPPGRIEAGEVCFEGQDLLKLTDEEMRKVRGSKISMIFQEPMTSLNPVYTVGDQISEVLEQHMGMAREEAMGKAVSLLRAVGIPEPERRVRQYPHEMSGGMRQRVMIAMALACDPKLLIADEPTTALDVTIQAQILELLKELKKRTGMAIMLITHDLGVVAEMADRVAVMYLGRVIEEGTVGDIFHRPLHPYTLGLLRSIPRMDRAQKRLHVIRGTVPNPMFMPKGCPFNNRCDYATEECREKEPEVTAVSGTHKVSCFNPVSAKGQVV